MKRLIVLAYAVFSTIALCAGNGLSAYTFLEMPPSAYSAAQGGQNVALSHDGVNNVFSNAALISEKENKQLSLSYSRYLNIANFGGAAYSQTWNSHTFSGGVRFLNYGQFSGYDEYGASTGTFTATDVEMVFSYSRMLYKGLSAGVSFKPIFSVYENYGSFALAVDVAAAYVCDKYSLSTGLAFLQIGRQVVTYDDDVQALPFNLVFSINKGFKHAPVILHFTYNHITDWDFDYVNKVSATNMLGVKQSSKISGVDMFFRHTIWGVDFVPFGGKFRVSASYNHRRAQELKLSDAKTIAGFSFGAGLYLKKFNLSMAASQYQSGVWNWQFNVGLDFDKILKK